MAHLTTQPSDRPGRDLEGWGTRASPGSHSGVKSSTQWGACKHNITATPLLASPLLRWVLLHQPPGQKKVGWPRACSKVRCPPGRLQVTLHHPPTCCCWCGYRESAATLLDPLTGRVQQATRPGYHDYPILLLLQGAADAVSVAATGPAAIACCSWWRCCCQDTRIFCSRQPQRR